MKERINKKTNRSLYIIVIVLAIALIVLIWRFYNQSANSGSGQDDQAIRALTEQFENAGKVIVLQKTLGNDAIFPEYYGRIEIMETMGTSYDDVLEDTKAGLIGASAQYWMAVKEGYSLPDDEFEEKMQKEIETMQELFRNDRAYSAAIKNSGITYEEQMAMNRESYRKNWSVGRYREAEKEKYRVENNLDNVTDMDAEWLAYWDEKSVDILREFETTSAYNALVKAFDDYDVYIQSHEDVIEAVQGGDVPEALKLTYSEVLN